MGIHGYLVSSPNHWDDPPSYPKVHDWILWPGRTDGTHAAETPGESTAVCYLRVSNDEGIEQMKVYESDQ